MLNLAKLNDDNILNKIKKQFQVYLTLLFSIAFEPPLAFLGFLAVATESQK